MTREEIIDKLELYTVGRFKQDPAFITVEELQNLIDEIKLLKQEPFKDAVSREYILEKLNEMNGTTELDEVFEIVENAPSTTPTRKVGKWEKHDTGHSIYYDCSLCACAAPCTETADKILWKLSNYCPDCGAKMQEVEEKWKMS